VWNQHLQNQLTTIGWTQSSVDKFVYYMNNVVFLVYIDDEILISPVRNIITKAITTLQSTLKISSKGTLNDYVGKSVNRMAKDKYCLSQPSIINLILRALNFNEDTKEAESSSPFHDHIRTRPGKGKTQDRLGI
jgi:hypothetical protein